MKNKETLPTWDEIPFQYVGGSPQAEAAYKSKDAPADGTLVKKSEVKNATTDYKNRKIGKIAIFNFNDKLVV